jgi:hypothetical protein
MADYVWDRLTGKQLAWINDGIMFCAATGQQIATVRDGQLHSIEGELLKLYLTELNSNPSENKLVPEAFKRLLGS